MRMSQPVEQAGTDAPRATQGREWEVFVREDEATPLQHAGSITAPNGEVAREQATELFVWSTSQLWLCPADEIERVADTQLEHR